MYLYKYFIIFLRFLIHFNVVLLNDQINVGTVLFTKRDSVKKCWNDEQIALLRARLIYQDILPKTTLIDLKNDEFLNALIYYFHSAIEKVKRLSDGPTQQINLMAMCDVLGGYFRSILIPLTKRAFYSGKINYETTQKVVKLYNNMKLFLHTDGMNWAPPSDKISSRFNRGAIEQPSKNNIGECDGNSCDQITYTNNSGFIYIPTPYFDSKTSPSAIALPFKENPLRNLEHKNAINCISNFFLVAKKCLREANATKENINKFNCGFEKFLDTEVYPHLTDEKIYPAFGGVFRVKNDTNCKSDLFLIEKRKINNTTHKRKTENDEIVAVIQDDDDKAPVIVLVCLCAVTALWLCITLYYCAKNRKKQTKDAIQKTEPSIASNWADEKRPSLTEKSPSLKDNRKPSQDEEKLAGKKISIVEPKSKPKKCQVCAQKTLQYGPKTCPKCKRKHCRCVTNIWSVLSNYTITYPRIFPKKNTATSGLLQKHLELKSGNQTVVSLCPQCKIPKCKHLNTFSGVSEHKSIAQNHFMVEMASVIPKAPARNIQSAPVTAGKQLWHSENTSKTTNKAEINEKIFVFGYDFETSSSDDSSFTDDSSFD